MNKEEIKGNSKKSSLTKTVWLLRKCLPKHMKIGEDGVKRSKYKNGSLLDGEEYKMMPGDRWQAD